MLKILAIGNSFSEDATVYLHDLALCSGFDSKIVNLYIGGCSLETHMKNVREDRAAYQYQLNGKDSGRIISIKNALLEEDWDIVTMQQASHFSGLEETYHPYLEQLIESVKTLVPAAKIWIHETWSYEIDSDHGGFASYDRSQENMYTMLKKVYYTAARKNGLPLIPCGDVIQTLRKDSRFDYANGGESLCRDGFHMNLCYGRYALSAVWFEKLFGGTILENSFLPEGVSGPKDMDKLHFIKQTVHRLCETK